jgi:hypothetical protein
MGNPLLKIIAAIVLQEAFFSLPAKMHSSNSGTSLRSIAKKLMLRKLMESAGHLVFRPTVVVALQQETMEN